MISLFKIYFFPKTDIWMTSYIFYSDSNLEEWVDEKKNIDKLYKSCLPLYTEIKEI